MLGQSEEMTSKLILQEFIRSGGMLGRENIREKVYEAARLQALDVRMGTWQEGGISEG